MGDLIDMQTRQVVGGALSICREPIATAPNDGTQILAWVGAGSMWDEDRFGRRFKREVGELFMLVRWFKFGDSPGYWSWHSKGQGKVQREPTHWTALHT